MTQSPTPPTAPSQGNPMPRPVPAPSPYTGGQMPQQMQNPYQNAAPQAPQGGQPMMTPQHAPQFAPQQQPAGAGHLPPMPAPQQAGGQYQGGQPAPQQGYNPAPMGAPMGMPMPHVDENAPEGGEKALPQISIHAFCDRQETAGVINQTTHDWRMRRTNVKIYMGGLRAAIDYYSKESTPSLIMVESGMRGNELFTQLETLASVCDEGTKVVIIGAANDIRLYRQLIEKGVSDYIVPPLLALSLIRSLSEIYNDPEEPFLGRVTAFFGAKGGVGSSTIAHNVAWCLSEHLHNDTALVDLDSSFGTTGLDFAYDNSEGLEAALEDPERLDEKLLDQIMIKHTDKLSILPAACSLHSKPVLDEHAYETVINAVRAVSPFSVLDMPHYWSDWTSNVLSSVDDVVITATPDLASLRNTKNLIDFLRTRRPNDPDPILILNKTGLAKAEIPVKEFGAAVGLEPNLVISFDSDTFYEASNEGKMLDQVKAAESTVAGLNYIANRLKTGQFSKPEAAGGGKRKGLRLGKSADGEDGSEKKSLFSFLNKGG